MSSKNYKANGCGHKRVHTLLPYTIVEVYRCGAIQTVESISFFQRLSTAEEKAGQVHSFFSFTVGPIILN